jgi:hypothetical protein
MTGNLLNSDLDTGSGVTKLQELPKKIFGLGYVIADVDGRIQLHTLRSNRPESWRAFGAKDRNEREVLKRRGYRCVFVRVEETSDE